MSSQQEKLEKGEGWSGEQALLFHKLTGRLGAEHAYWVISLLADSECYIRKYTCRFDDEIVDFIPIVKPDKRTFIGLDINIDDPNGGYIPTPMYDPKTDDFSFRIEKADRLLTVEESDQIANKVNQELYETSSAYFAAIIEKIKEAQDTRTASILEAQCQERIRAYVKDSMEILENAQGEWKAVTMTYAPEWVGRLRNAAELLKQTLKEQEMPK